MSSGVWKKTKGKGSLEVKVTEKPPLGEKIGVLQGGSWVSQTFWWRPGTARLRWAWKPAAAFPEDMVQCRIQGQPSGRSPGGSEPWRQPQAQEEAWWLPTVSRTINSGSTTWSEASRNCVWNQEVCAAKSLQEGLEENQEDQRLGQPWIWTEQMVQPNPEPRTPRRPGEKVSRLTCEAGSTAGTQGENPAWGPWRGDSGRIRSPTQSSAEEQMPSHGQDRSWRSSFKWTQGVKVNGILLQVCREQRWGTRKQCKALGPSAARDWLVSFVR